MDIETSFQPDPINGVIGAMTAEQNDELQEHVLALVEEAGITGEDSTVISAMLLRAFLAGCAWAIVQDEEKTDAGPQEGPTPGVTTNYWIDAEGLWHITLTPEAAMLVLSFSLEGGFTA